ncbi:FAD-dependent oxidoreductase [Micromonospora chalcea]
MVLGGGQRRSDDTTPDPAEEADVLARCVAIEPALAAAEVLEHTVGLRPGRAAPRVAAEWRGDALVVHNYGHAGNGVMLSWDARATPPRSPSAPRRPPDGTVRTRRYAPAR